MNVSRNPSDASEKSSSTVPLDEPTEPERSVDRISTEIDEKEREETNSVEREDRSSVDKEEEKEEKHVWVGVFRIVADVVFHLTN